jgi:uncharacterized protein (DUF1786 family)
LAIQELNSQKINQKRIVALLEHKLSKLNPDEIEELYKTNELKFSTNNL